MEKNALHLDCFLQQFSPSVACLCRRLRPISEWFRTHTQKQVGLLLKLFLRVRLRDEKSGI